MEKQMIEIKGGKLILTKSRNDFRITVEEYKKEEKKIPEMSQG